MANVLTDLAADIYKAADVVAREQVGFIPAVTINGSSSERVAVGGVVRSAFTRPATAVDVTAAMTIPEGTDQTVDNKTATISKSKAVQIPWTGEDMRYVNNGGGFETIYGGQIAQAMRTLANLVEIDLATEAYKNASRATGTAGTTPFSTNHNVVNSVRQILIDNGVPQGDNQLSLVMNTVAGTNFRNLSNLYKVNEAGSDMLLRQGVLQDISGIMMRESAGIQLHTKGTGSGYLVNGALAVGDSTIATDTGSGTLLQGDIFTFAADTTNKYVANSALAGGSFTIADSGIRAAIADNNAITIGNSYTANVAFHRAAIELIVRPPAVPTGGDAAVDSMLVQDPRSGLVFEIRVYKGYKKAMFEVAVAWGVKAWMPKYIATLMG
jgi:hypothetical protein